ncbi:MAG: winged helix-turn-helix domain-containing protein [Verrucomicrobiales bacterium]|jgi:DNA-binding transcriptional ArsR family regulator|nr:winged helix-turn-helix domain-containing protein [Verrucomicrobiales bacterium]
MLSVIFNGKVAEKVMLHLYHYGEIHASGIARDAALTVSSVQAQLAKFENAGLLVSRLVGKVRIYSFNPKSPYARPLKELLRVAYETLPLTVRQKMFAARRRPRRAGKPVLPS